MIEVSYIHGKVLCWDERPDPDYTGVLNWQVLVVTHNYGYSHGPNDSHELPKNWYWV
jgi:hypothetical protein